MNEVKFKSGDEVEIIISDSGTGNDPEFIGLHATIKGNYYEISGLNCSKQYKNFFCLTIEYYDVSCWYWASQIRHITEEPLTVEQLLK